jgi:predicted nucleic acid-binding protein
MTQVIDASVAVSLFIDDAFSGPVRRDVFADANAGRLVAPALILLELHGALAKRLASGHLKPADLAAAPAALNALVAIAPLDKVLAGQALSLSQGGIEAAIHAGDGRPLPASAYDAFYIALALAGGHGLITSDRRQAAIAMRLGVATTLLAPDG